MINTVDSIGGMKMKNEAVKTVYFIGGKKISPVHSGTMFRRLQSLH
jgi:hypothetical protein